jgi:hypothetical protein
VSTEIPPALQAIGLDVSFIDDSELYIAQCDPHTGFGVGSTPAWALRDLAADLTDEGRNAQTSALLEHARLIRAYADTFPPSRPVESPYGNPRMCGWA